MTHTRVDLHVHSSYSDGKFSPEEILRYAANNGITTLALTDHDNTNGVRHALPLAQELNIELIPAIELTCCCRHWNTPAGGDDIDLLGYFIDLDNENFRRFEQAVLHDMYDRLKERCERLTTAGYPITLEEIFAEHPQYISGLHLALALQRKGYATHWRGAFDIMDATLFRARPSSFSLEQAIEQIHQAGGCAVLAHPHDILHQNVWLQVEQFEWLVDIGLDGVEVYHRRQKEDARQHFFDLAQHFDLAMSGGSDLHGWTSDFEGFGQQPITLDMVESLRTRARA